MAAEQHFTYRGERRFDVPRDGTRFSVDESMTVIPARAFAAHKNIVELRCHAGVQRVEKYAFDGCPSLKLLIVPGVKVVEDGAFCDCEAVTDIECDKLERIGEDAFIGCGADPDGINSINLPSAKIVGRNAFKDCGVRDVIFGKELESIREWAFRDCPNLERITIPLKNGLFAQDNVFRQCKRLVHVDLVEDDVLRETIAALLLEDWRNDMNEEIDSINQSLPNISAGTRRHAGEKTRVIRWWLTSVLHKIIHYKAKHRRLVDEAANVLSHAFPKDVVVNHVLPLLELPSYNFDGEEYFSN